MLSGLAVEETEPCCCSVHYKKNLTIATDSHVDLNRGQQEDDALIYTSPDQARTGTEIRTPDRSLSRVLIDKPFAARVFTRFVARLHFLYPSPSAIAEDGTQNQELHFFTF